MCLKQEATDSLAYPGDLAYLGMPKGGYIDTISLPKSVKGLGTPKGNPGLKSNQSLLENLSTK